jgi:hypothetical protein
MILIIEFIYLYYNISVVHILMDDIELSSSATYMADQFPRSSSKS